jgi:hypothetical protein
MLDSYISKIAVMFVGVGAGITAVVGGYYSLFKVVTYLGN